MRGRPASERADSSGVGARGARAAANRAPATFGGDARPGMAAEQVRGDTRPTGGRQLGEQVATGGLSFGYCESMSRNRRRGADHPWMTGGKAHEGGKNAHGAGQFIRRLRMKRALGIKCSGSMWPTRHMRGPDRRRGTWWDQKLNCIAIEGQDFAQDTQEGGADRYVLIPDSDEERGAKGSSLLGDDDEYVPETEPQDVVPVSRIIGPRQRLGTMLHDWLRIISHVDNGSDKMDMKSNKVHLGDVKLEKEIICSTMLHAGFLDLQHVDYLNQMDGHCCHLVHKQADDYRNTLSPTHIRV